MNETTEKTTENKSVKWKRALLMGLVTAVLTTALASIELVLYRLVPSDVRYSLVVSGYTRWIMGLLSSASNIARTFDNFAWILVSFGMPWNEAGIYILRVLFWFLAGALPGYFARTWQRALSILILIFFINYVIYIILFSAQV